jgi:hypothetical protein
VTGHSHIVLSDRGKSVLLAWPTQGDAGGLVQFEGAANWRVLSKTSVLARTSSIRTSCRHARFTFQGTSDSSPAKVVKANPAMEYRRSNS